MTKKCAPDNTAIVTVRCPSCMNRFSPGSGKEVATCTFCHAGWRLSWPTKKTAMIRSPQDTKR